VSPHLFVPAVVPPEDVDPNAAGWVILRAGAILLHEGGVLAPPPASLALSPARAVYLGKLDGRPFFAADVDAEEGTPDDRFVPVRSAFILSPPGLFGILAAAAELIHFERTSLFCERCAARLAPKGVDRGKKCPSCGHEIYPRVSPAIIVLVRDERGRAILAHRPKMPFFSLVAGFVESGESFEECVVREVKEEIGVDVDRVRYFGSQTWPFPHQIMVGFFARHSGGDIAVDGEEIDEARWFTPGDLPVLPPPISIARALIDAWLAEVEGAPAPTGSGTA
jgi:NAD+ diphosphatase